MKGKTPQLYRIMRPGGSGRIVCPNPLQLERKYFEGFNPVYQFTDKGWIPWTGVSPKSAYTPRKSQR